ncbi:MAG: inositol monophosphatase family protein, partial [Planctomycetota bacterium]
EAMAKLGREPVTVADYGSQAVILRLVREAFPDHGVVSEEGSANLRASDREDLTQDVVSLVGDAIGVPAAQETVCEWIDHQGKTDAEFVWAVDPIDGTKGFLRHDQFAVAIGVLRAGEPFAGALACPNLPVHPGKPEGARGVLFLAARGRGATQETLQDARPRPVAVSPAQDPARLRAMGSVEAAHGDPRILRALIQDMKLGGGIVRMDSQVKYGAVARGDAEIYLRPRSNPDYRENIWDHAAGVAVVEEAGGRVTDLDGRPLDFRQGSKLVRNRGVLATNGAVHETVLEHLRRVEKVS